MRPLILALVMSSLAMAQSFTGSLNPTDPNDVFLVRFTLSTSATVRIQSWGYGGSASAPGGTNAAGTVIAAGGFDPYISLFAGTGINATFLASNDDGLCPPGTRVSGFCLDPTLTINLPAGSYTLAFSVFENFSFAENLGVGTVGDLFINLGNYYDAFSNTLRTPRYAFDIAGNGVIVIGTGHVVEPPTLSKTFANASIPVNGSTALTFTIANPGLIPLTGISFNDPLPAGLVIDAPAITPACGGTLTTTVNSISLANATLQPLTNCQFTVIVRGATPGLKNNLTSAINSIEGGAGLPAAASITVGGNFLISYAANLNAGDSVINITNTGANGAALNGPGFGAAAGNICVNVYAFSPDEQMVSCCACLLTPNALASLSVKEDLIANTLTGIRPNSMVVKLLATGAGAGFTGTACTNSAAVAGQNAANPLIVSGALAFGTTIHLQGTGLAVTEVPFTPATLSLAELASITNRCTNIIGNGSTFGICRSCRAGGLNSSR